MNEPLAYDLGKVHMACRTSADYSAALKSCRYPEWGYVSVNRRALNELNQIHQADWYTWCKKIPNTSNIPAVCRANRRVLTEPEADKKGE